MGVAAEGKYTWHGYLLVPLKLDEEQKIEFCAQPSWVNWRQRLGEEAETKVSDIRRFFLKPLQDVLVPNIELRTSRYSFLNDGTKVRLPVLCDEANKEIGCVEWMDVLLLPTFSLLLLKINVPEKLDARELHEINRRAVAWCPRYEGEDIAYWCNGDGQQFSLREWIQQDLLSNSGVTGNDVFGDTDWFGHILPSVSLVVEQESEDAGEDAEHLITLLMGVPYENPAYAIDENEINRLSQQSVLRVWKDWCVGELNHRVVFYKRGDGGALVKNLENSYTPMVASVVYQKLMYTYFLERYHDVHGAKAIVKARDELTGFRNRYAHHSASTYYLGERIFQFVMGQFGVSELGDRLREEIESADEYERLRLERAENKTLTALTMLAAITIPATTVATVLALGEEKLLHPGFWLPTLVMTAIFLLPLLYLVLSNGKRK